MFANYSFDDHVYVTTPRSARPNDKERRGRKGYRERYINIEYNIIK